MAQVEPDAERRSRSDHRARGGEPEGGESPCSAHLDLDVRDGWRGIDDVPGSDDEPGSDRDERGSR